MGGGGGRYILRWRRRYACRWKVEVEEGGAGEKPGGRVGGKASRISTKSALLGGSLHSLE